MSTSTYAWQKKRKPKVKQSPAITEDALQARIESAVSREVSRRLARLAVPQKRGGGCG